MDQSPPTLKLVTLSSPPNKIISYELEKALHQLLYGVLALVAYFVAGFIESWMNANLNTQISPDIRPYVAMVAPAIVLYLRSWAAKNEYTVLLNPQTHEVVKEVGPIDISVMDKVRGTAPANPVTTPGETGTLTTQPVAPQYVPATQGFSNNPLEAPQAPME